MQSRHPMEDLLVRPARRRTVKAAVALAALERPMVGVDVHVHLEGAALAERVAAHVAAVRPLAGVRQLVLLEHLADLEGAAACVAAERPHVAVQRAQVRVQVVLVVELAAALVALERFLAAVRAHVNGALTAAEEAPLARAKLARERALAGVDALVHHQIALFGHLLAADLAAVRLRFGVGGDDSRRRHRGVVGCGSGGSARCSPRVPSVAAVRCAADGGGSGRRTGGWRRWTVLGGHRPMMLLSHVIEYLATELEMLVTDVALDESVAIRRFRFDLVQQRLREGSGWQRRSRQIDRYPKFHSLLIPITGGQIMLAWCRVNVLLN